MKKHFYPVIAATTLLMAASCSQDEELVSGSNGNEEVVTFTVNAGVATRAAGDGNTVDKVHYEVWDKNTGKLVISTIPNSGAMTSARAEGVQAGRANVSMSLVKGVPYDITFWAQNEDGSAYDISAGLDEIKLKEGPKANKEDYDAFFKTIVDYKVKSGSTTVELKRPFAQVNVGTAPADWARAIALGVEIDQSTITVSGIHNQFNARSAEASGNASVTFALNDILDETFTVKDSTYQYLAMNYMLADSASTLHNMEVTFNDGTQEINTLSITNMPIQRNWRTNIVGRVLTSDEDFEIIILPEFEGDHNIYTANSSDELNRILRECTDDDIVIDLGTGVTRGAAEPITYYVEVNNESNSTYLYGQNNTKTITINGNGNIINFVHTEGDNNWLSSVNGATKWILNDLKLTNSGKNDGSWNRHDIGFYNPVELNNVTSDKAIKLANDGKLNKVEISENGDVYGLWITAEGQTVEADKLTINSAGRGITINEQYLTHNGKEVKKVTLNVKNSKFNTVKKAAVLVTSPAGADITWGEGNDISNVAADPINAVWVDTEYKDYADKVTATGCSVVVEGTASVADSDDAISAAIKAGASQIILPAGTYIIPEEAKGKTLTIIGTGNPEDTKIATQDDGSYEGCDYSLDGSTVTFENITINTTSKTYTGYARCNGTYKNCVINGTYTLYGNSTFEGCTFNVSGDVYNIWTWGAPEASFTGCTFNSDGKALLLYGQANTKLTLTNCTFNDNGGLSDKKAAIEIGNDYNKSYELIVDNVTVNGYEINDKGINTGTTLWGNKNSMGTDKLNVVVDGVEVY